MMAGTTNKPIKLYYFNVYARGESIRMLLHNAKVEFEDVRFDMGAFKQLKLESPEKFEFGQVPVVEAPFLPNEEKGYFA